MRRIVTILSIAGLVASIAPGRPVGASTAVEKTIVRRVSPVTVDGALKPGYRVVRSARGRCWEPSIASQQRRAYRCFDRNVIRDPCFAASRHVVYCLRGPWTHLVTRLRIRRLPVDRNPGVTRLRLPWGMELAGGRRCILGTGTAASVGHTLLPYVCSHGYATEPTLSATRWIVRVAPPSLGRLRRRAVAVALF